MAYRGNTENRILVLTPTGDDAIQACHVLNQAGILCLAVIDIEELSDQISQGAGAVLIAEEAIFSDKFTPLLDELGHQPAWSDLPLLAITSRPDSEEGGLRILELFSNIGSLSFLQRPLTPMTLITSARTALRARRKQYQVRDLLLEQKCLQLKAEEALKARNEFISIASHELKTPITSLKLRLQMAAKDFNRSENKMPSMERLERLFEIGNHQVNRLNSLVEDLLDISRIQSGKLSMNLDFADISQILRATLDRLAEHIASAGCILETSIREGIFGLWDQHRIEQVVINLIANALKYAPNSKLYVQLTQTEGRTHLSIRDDGCGIPLEKQKRLFQRFERAGASRNIGGLGLGLYIVRQIIEAHFGTIRVESSPGKGACFIIELPIRSQSVKDNDTEASA